MSRSVLLAHCRRLVEQHDRLAYILAQYLPEPVQPTQYALRALAIEVNRISTHTKAQAAGHDAAALKFAFWSDMLTRVWGSPWSAREVGEPVGTVFRQALRDGLPLPLEPLLVYLQTRLHHLRHPSFATTELLCAYGEGTYSQLTYVLQAGCLDESIAPTAVRALELAPEAQRLFGEVAAHIGQATGVATMLAGARYYAEREEVVVPELELAQVGVSQETAVRMLIKEEPESDELRAAVFATATTANDHLLTASSKLKEATEAFTAAVAQLPPTRITRAYGRHLPLALYTPLMGALPTQLYLERLQSADFSLVATLRPSALAWRSWWAHRRRRI